MALGVAFLVLFLPLIAVFIADNFVTITGMLSNAVSVLSVVPVVSTGLWSVLPSYLTSVIIAILVVTLSVNLLKRFIG